MTDELYQTLEEAMRVVTEINALNERTRKRLARLMRIQVALIVVLVAAIILNVTTLLYRVLA